MKPTLTGGRSLDALWCVAVCVLPIWSAQAELAQDVFSLLQQTVVVIDTEEGHGTGFVASADGIVLTNAHVVEGDMMTVTHADGRTEIAQFIGFERDGHDLAALRLPGGAPRPWLPLADPALLRVGMTVYAAGNPYPTFPVTVSGGIIGSLSERYGMMLIDANIASGSSGSPVINSSGQALGIVTARLLDQSGRGLFAFESASGFGTALDAKRLHSFLADVRLGAVTAIRQANMDWLTLPLPQLVPPAEHTGRLSTDSDQLLFDRSFVNGYTLDLETGQIVTIEMLSDEFDTYLMLVDPHGEIIAENDDSDENTTDSRISFSVQQSGRYVVLANAQLARATGVYRIRAHLQIFGPAEVFTGTLSAGRSRTAEIDWQRALRGRSGRTVSIQMLSDEFDSYLELLDERGRVIASNDDMEIGTLDARIIHRFDDDGRYTIRATSFSRRSTGAFEVQVAWAEE
jgi:hypothetical protein